jgi:CSLREA domain-containing protein
LGLLLLVLALAAWPGSSAQALTITVNTTNDAISNDGKCSLREAIIAANQDKPSGTRPGECPAGSGADLIVLPAGVYGLIRTDNGKEDAAQTGDLDISAPLEIRGAAAGVTVVDGSGLTDRVFHALAGPVTLSGMTVRNGSTTDSGGGAGAGIHNATTLTVRDSMISGNRAQAAGGGIYNTATGNLIITGSTLDGNSAADRGGGLFNDGGTVR